MGDPTYDNAADLDREGIPSLDEPPTDDEGTIPPGDQPRGASQWGTTANEERQRESIAVRLAQEEPELTEDDIDLRFADDEPVMAGLAAGQLLQPGDEDVDVADDDPAMVAAAGAGGTRGGGIALSAEEEAVHFTDRP
jgi:hypothetical protein